MKTAETKHRAFALFLKCKSLRRISAELGLARSTVERWCKAGEWVDQRAIYLTEQRTKAMKEMLKDSAQHYLTASQVAHANLLEAIAENRAVSEGRIPSKARKYKSRQILGLYRIYAMASTADLNLCHALEIYYSRAKANERSA
jgi:IS30 family transposase